MDRVLLRTAGPLIFWRGAWQECSKATFLAPLLFSLVLQALAEKIRKEFPKLDLSVLRC